MKKLIGIICVLLMIVPISSSTFSAEITIKNGQNPSSYVSTLEITDVSLSDSTLLCQLFGGQTISINVTIKNNANVDYSDSFVVELYTNQVSYLTEQSFTNDIKAGESITVCFSNVHIAVELGEHTLDAYFSGDIHSRKYDVFTSTLTGSTVYENGIKFNLLQKMKKGSTEPLENGDPELDVFLWPCIGNGFRRDNLEIAVKNVGDATAHNVTLIDLIIDGNVVYNNRETEWGRDVEPGTTMMDYPGTQFVGFGVFEATMTVTCDEGATDTGTGNGIIIGFMIFVP